MRMKIFSQSFELTDAIVRHIEDRIHRALGPASDQINVVFVRLTDINSKRSGVDKRCRLVIWFHHLGSIVVQSVHEDLYAAVDDATARAKVAAWRHLKRRVSLRREYAYRDPSLLRA